MLLKGEIVEIAPTIKAAYHKAGGRTSSVVRMVSDNLQ